MSPSHSSPSTFPWISLFFLFIAMVSVQTGSALAKAYLFPILGASGVVAFRLFFGALILLLVFQPWRMRISSASVKFLLGYGLSVGAMNYLFYLALARIPLGIGVAVEFIGPLAVSLYASRRFFDFVWVGMVVLGLFFLLPIAHQNMNSLDLVGVLLALAAGVCWGSYILFGKRVGMLYGTRSVSIGMSVACIAFVPIGVFESDWQLMFQWEIIFLGLMVAILSTVLPFSFEMLALSRLPAKTFGVLMSLEPVMATLMGIIFLKEHLTIMQWLALICIVLAALGSSYSSTKK